MRKNSFTFKMTGFDKIQRNLSRMRTQVPAAIETFVEDEAKKFMELSKKNAPVETGRLRDSHRVRTEKKGKEIRAEVIAGGINVRGEMVDYAADVHENTPYLENAVKEQGKGFDKRLAKTVKKELKKIR